MKTVIPSWETLETICPECGESGLCTECGGTGSIEKRYEDDETCTIEEIACHECGGSGLCEECNGAGAHPMFLVDPPFTRDLFEEAFVGTLGPVLIDIFHAGPYDQWEIDIIKDPRQPRTVVGTWLHRHKGGTAGFYRVHITRIAENRYDMKCTCPYFTRKHAPCKHILATQALAFPETLQKNLSALFRKTGYHQVGDE